VIEDSDEGGEDEGTAPSSGEFRRLGPYDLALTGHRGTVAELELCSFYVSTATQGDPGGQLFQRYFAALQG